MGSGVLILPRKVQQGVFIGRNIDFEVLDIKGDRIQIGIIAPSEIPVIREELFQREEQRRTIER